MRNYLDAKAMARQLRARLAEKSVAFSHSECLELVAGQFGYRDWNTLAARIALAQRDSADLAAGIRLRAVTPVLRIFSREKAAAFYQDYLGFRLDWRDPDDAQAAGPQYLQLSRGKLTLHLSEHHGDGSPGSTVWIRMKGLDAFHAELAAKPYPFLRPGIEAMPPRLRVMRLLDPFGNQLRFGEFTEAPLASPASA